MNKLFLPNFRSKLQQLKKVQNLTLSFVSGLLLWMSWPVSSLTFLIFFAFIPLLLLADTVAKRSSFGFYVFLSFFIWNIGTTWWLWNSTEVGAIAAFMVNGVLMSFIWVGYFLIKRRFGKNIGYAALISFWMLFEYIHLNWELTWPWLTIGNVFATKTGWIQWYEYTGVSGGTLWVLLVNILMYEFLFSEKKINQKISKVVPLVALIIIPLGISWLLGNKVKSYNKERQLSSKNILIVQPDIDPYQKFESNNISQDIQKLVSLSEQNTDSSTQLVVWPETALAAGIVIDDIQKEEVYRLVFDYVKRHPNLTLLTGIETYKVYGKEKVTSSARRGMDGNYYDALNAAITIKANEPIQLYTKSKLVPGVETLPSFLNFMAPLFEQFGGTTGGYARDTAAAAFKISNTPYIAAPIICYESIYGEYVTQYVQKGANLLTIITNDGWWDNTPGHRQHLQYARLRAIETRKYVVRSANTGISAVIDNAGHIKETRKWDETSVIKCTIPAIPGETFYVRYGDYLYKIFSVLALLIIGWNVFFFVKDRYRKIKST